MKVENFITTYRGYKFYPLDLESSVIDIEDIAHALSLTCRYGGHCREFYSVAEHSFRVANELPPSLRLAGLLHDASEAYISDVPRPIKEILSNYKELEHKIQAHIYSVFNVGEFDEKIVKQADNTLLMNEGVHLMDNMDGWIERDVPVIGVVIPFSPHLAERMFLECFEELQTEVIYED